jgi:hypothetical protein
MVIYKEEVFQHYGVDGLVAGRGFITTLVSSGDGEERGEEGPGEGKVRSVP